MNFSTEFAAVARSKTTALAGCQWHEEQHLMPIQPLHLFVCHWLRQCEVQGWLNFSIEFAAVARSKTTALAGCQWHGN
jgi:hypothetical protein